MSCAHLHRVDDHFRAGLTRTAEQALRLHLPACAACRARYERHLLLERLSGKTNAKQRLARALGLRLPRRLRFALPLAGLSVVSAAAAMLIVFLRAPVHSEFGVRGSNLPALSAVTELLIFRATSSGRPEPVASSMSARDELGFSYRNPTGKQRLLIFARDAHDHFYWYQPAWIREADDPQAVPILGGLETHELGEVVAHDFDADRIVLFAVFTDQPLSVRALEGLAKKQPLDRLELARALVIATPLRVKR